MARGSLTSLVPVGTSVPRAPHAQDIAEDPHPPNSRVFIPVIRSKQPSTEKGNARGGEPKNQAIRQINQTQRHNHHNDIQRTRAKGELGFTSMIEGPKLANKGTGTTPHHWYHLVPVYQGKSVQKSTSKACHNKNSSKQNSNPAHRARVSRHWYQPVPAYQDTTKPTTDTTT
jgi:hypothetical protein